MALPVIKVTMPPDLVNAPNGRLGPELLTDIAFPGRPSGGQLHFQAARAWWALSAACLAATGVVLTITSIADAYRRYSRSALARSSPLRAGQLRDLPPHLHESTARFFLYGGHKYWRLRKGLSPSATPGTSNHGWGLALDVCEITGSGHIIGMAASRAWPWLKENLLRYGMSWEYTKEGVEDWHVRLHVGANTTAAVVAFEQGNVTSPVPVWDPLNGKYALWPIAVKPRIGPMSQGDIVLYAQCVMYEKSAGGNIPRHGFYDLETIERVKELQAWFNLTPDGWIGPQTWATIDQLAGS
jgi:hypothetical protein